MSAPPGYEKSPDSDDNHMSGLKQHIKQDTKNITAKGNGRKGISRGAAARRLGDARRIMGSGDRARDLGNWRAFGFIAGNALALFRPGPYYERGIARAGRWPDLTVESALGPKGSPARKPIEALADEHGAYIKERVLDAISEGLTDGQKWTVGKRKLVSASEAAKRLCVDMEEREELSLRSIGAVDCPRHILEADARDRKRARDRERMAGKRRAAGKATREEFEKNSVTRAAPWVAMGVSRSTYYARRKEANGKAWTGVSLHNRDRLRLSPNLSEATDLSDHRREGPSALSQKKPFPSFERFRGSGTPAQIVTTERECGHDQRRRSAPNVDDPEGQASTVSAIDAFRLQEVDGTIGATGAMLHAKRAGQFVFIVRATR